ncbi:hypothetical protein [Bacillus toyonensis]|uniref:hypothetical protein n=1 Tax=Bacillus toyonensis TaxID=155322 RepID=UPI0019075463|nr:hypothetical protein [Bacillus toyonensis]QQN86467.1 hypothetical protein I0K03_28900 [Bacillus toyonensis]
MEIYEYLDQIQTELLDHSWQEIEVKYYALCSKLAGEEQAKRIRNIDLDPFQNKLNDTLYTSIYTADKHSAAAIYFEYDMDNDWASDWINEVEGPDLKGFARIYAESGFDDNEKTLGTTLYLVVRTVTVFKRVVESVKTNIPICIGFHDQDPIMRIQE